MFVCVCVCVRVAIDSLYNLCFSTRVAPFTTQWVVVVCGLVLCINAVRACMQFFTSASMHLLCLALQESPC